METSNESGYINTIYDHNYDEWCNVFTIILVNDTDKTQTVKLEFDGEFNEPNEIAPGTEYTIEHGWSERICRTYESIVKLNIIGNNTSIDFQETSFLTELEVNNPYLKKLDCCGCEKLKTITLNNIEAVNEVHFSFCDLDEDAINKLFEALPVNNEGIIYIQGNPGTNNCDRSIAEKKGWKFEEYNLGKG